MNSTIARLVLVSIVAAFAGCAASRTVDVAATSPWVFHSEQSDGQSVARCIMKNIDERYGHMDARLETDSRPGLVEIRVRQADVGVAGMVEIEPAEKGSTITVRISNDYLNRDPIAKAFASGC
jgi:hypothetical protein